MFNFLLPLEIESNIKWVTQSAELKSFELAKCDNRDGVDWEEKERTKLNRNAAIIEFQEANMRSLISLLAHPSIP